MVQAFPQTTVIPQLRVDRAVDAPVMQVVQFRTSSKARCIWQSLYCSPLEYRTMDFLGDLFRMFSVFNTPRFDSGYMFGVSLRGLLEEFQTWKLLRLLHQRKPLRLPAFQRLRPIPMMTGTLSSMHMASPRLPVALRPPSPSRPTPLELVGAPATSAAAVCARPPSALCGGRSNVLSGALRAFGWCGVQLRLCVLLRRCWASFSLATRG